MPDRGDQIPRRARFCHHGIGQPNAEGLFEPEQQLHPLEAADAEIAVERVIQHGPSGAAATQLGDEARDDVEDLVIDGGVGCRSDRQNAHRQRMFHWLMPVFVFAALLHPAAGLSAQQASYTGAQAEIGATIYQSACAACHLPTLQGSGNAPPLAGTGFRSNWGNRPAAEVLALADLGVPVLTTVNGKGVLDETHPAWPASIYGSYKAAVELHLKAYHATHAMNTSAWRPATMYGLNPKLQKSLWFDLVKTVREGGEVSTDADGLLVHVEDVAEALALAIGDESVAGQFYNLVDCDLEWQEAAEITRVLYESAAVIRDRPSRPKQQPFNPAKAVAFFDRHGNGKALRRGREGVAQYLAALLKELPPNHILERPQSGGDGYTPYLPPNMA